VLAGKFKHKTRVLVTHAVDFLHLVDSVVLIKDGRIQFKAPYSEIKDHPYVKELMDIHQSHE